MPCLHGNWLQVQLGSYEIYAPEVVDIGIISSINRPKQKALEKTYFFANVFTKDVVKRAVSGTLDAREKRTRLR